jgi:hypothetical protein
MKIEDHGIGKLAVVCDACNVPLGPDGLVGLHHREVICIHEHCRSAYDFYFRVTAERQLSLGAFIDELNAAIP